MQYFLLPQPLLAFFSAPWMLLWLAAAAAPILIHLWNRRKFREESWAAIEFLLAAMKKNSRRIQIEQLLLLAIRTLIVILAVTALAQPFIKQFGFVPNERTLHVLVIDGSYSMAYKPTDKTRFERAKQIATQIVDGASTGDGFVLVLMGSSPQVIVETPAFEASDFIEEIENLKLPHGGGNLPDTVATVEQLIGRIKQDDPRLVQRRVYFLTDLGATTWEPEFDDGAAAARFRQQIAELAEQASLSVFDLGQSGSGNLAVTNFRTTAPFVTVSQKVHFEADVRNFGSQDSTQQLIEFFVDGRRVAARRLNVAAGESTATGFSHQFETPGDHQLEARLAADQLDVDNHRWIGLSVKQHISVLCVNSKQPGEADYLSLALNPDHKTADRPVIRPYAVSESALWDLQLDAYDCVFLCNVGRFSTSEAKILDSYLKGGGGLVFFLGDRVLADGYNDTLSDTSAGGTRVLPVRLESTRTAAADQHFTFDPLDYQHPITKAFANRQSSGLLDALVYKYMRMIPMDAVEGRHVPSPVLNFNNGDPAIVEAKIHRGRSIVVAFPSSTASRIDQQSQNRWTTIPAMRFYVPLVQEILKFAIRGQLQQRNVTVGDPIGSTVHVPAANVSLVMHAPDARVDAMRVRISEDDRRWTYDQTDFSGIYTAELGPPVSETQSFALNIDMQRSTESDSTESDLRKVDPEDLRQLSDAFEVSTRWQNLDTQLPVEWSATTGVHRYLLYLVLVLLFVETGLAWWLGNRSA
ncbi:MAG: BatA domain-containing protein [Planctomycetes bacterium]|nr:BatA domain-containing protein [Planctomycetota bacterium]